MAIRSDVSFYGSRAAFYPFYREWIFVMISLTKLRIIPQGVISFSITTVS